MVTAATVAVNPAVATPAETVTLLGTVAFALPLDSDTVSPPVGAAPLSVTVHDDVPGAFTVAGVQTKLLTVTGGFTVTPAVLFCPFQLAVTVTV